MPSAIHTIDNIQLSWEDFYWEGVIARFGQFGDEVGLHINTKDEEEIPPHRTQDELLVELLSDSSDLYTIVIKALLEYYCDIRPKYESAGAEWVKSMPIITEAKEVSLMVCLNYIEVHYPYEGSDPKIGLSFGCDWDREHGAGVMLQSGKIISVGGADAIH